MNTKQTNSVFLIFLELWRLYKKQWLTRDGGGGTDGGEGNEMLIKEYKFVAA